MAKQPCQAKMAVAVAATAMAVQMAAVPDSLAAVVMADLVGLAAA